MAQSDASEPPESISVEGTTNRAAVVMAQQVADPGS